MGSVLHGGAYLRTRSIELTAARPAHPSQRSVRRALRRCSKSGLNGGCRSAPKISRIANRAIAGVSRIRGNFPERTGLGSAVLSLASAVTGNSEPRTTIVIFTLPTLHPGCGCQERLYSAPSPILRACCMVIAPERVASTPLAVKPRSSRRREAGFITLWIVDAPHLESVFSTSR